MSGIKHRNSGATGAAGVALAIFLVTLAAGPIGCAKKSQPQAQEQARRYHLVGKIVEVQKDQNTLVIDGQAIPGFMDAMTMPYVVRQVRYMEGLNPGDEITADVVVDSQGAYLENVVVTKKASGNTPAARTTQLHEPQPGDKVPDFALVNQNGKSIHLNSFRGHVLLVTFIYTRCPFPNYCPLVSHEFAEIYAATRKNPQLDSKVRLLTVSFDAAHDTPAVLLAYGKSFQHAAGAVPFDRWEFAVAPAKELPKVADFFGLTYSINGGQIVHSMSTTVVSPDGTVYKWYDDNSWQPSDLIEDATQALQQESDDDTSHAHAHPPRAGQVSGS
jgi:protein SCO1